MPNTIDHDLALQHLIDADLNRLVEDLVDLEDVFAKILWRVTTEAGNPESDTGSFQLFVRRAARL